MGRDDWYRGTAWDPQTEEHFEAKLARARVGSRAQYLRIKGLELTGADDQTTRAVGRGLLKRVVDDYRSDPLMWAWAHSDLAISLAADGHLEDAAHHFEQALGADRPEPSAALGLAEVIYRARWRHRYEEALELLVAGGAASDPFPATRFRWNLTAARLSDGLGQHDNARELAQIALRCLDETGSPFPRHRSSGIASADSSTRRELKRLASR